jgi:Cupredoxin-like domain
VEALLGELDVPFPEQAGRRLTPLAMMRLAISLLFAASIAAGAGAGARAEELYSATVTIRGHRFEPTELHVPAGKRIALTVINADPLSEEFDSTALKVEKVIAGKSQGIVHISPLNPGRYDFIGEYHEDTAKGQVIAE